LPPFPLALGSALRRPRLPTVPCAQTTSKKTILPEMARAPATNVVILRISSNVPAGIEPQRIFSTRHRYQMHVVGHHAPSQQLHSRFA
jgi:hypothetical protein